jgi:hypothetical protein
MSVQKCILNKQSQNFTVIPNKIIQGLTHLGECELLGFYTYICSLPPNWEFHKTHLRKTCKMGINKIDLMVKKLIKYKLLEITRMRNPDGTFAHFDWNVLNGDLFRINDLDKVAHPVYENPCMDNHTMDLVSYKRNIDKVYIKATNKELYCATEKVAQERVKEPSPIIEKNIKPNRFEEFWLLYPRKKDKKRAKKIWDRINKDHDTDMILKDIRNRLLNDRQWKNEQFIPHPSTYLNNELWNDEIDLKRDFSNKDAAKSPSGFVQNKIDERIRSIYAKLN